jgi:hypothetical protein
MRFRLFKWLALGAFPAVVLVLVFHFPNTISKSLIVEATPEVGPSPQLSGFGQKISIPNSVNDSIEISSWREDRVKRLGTKEQVALTGSPKQALFSSAVQSRSDAGYVLEIEGKWFVESNPREYLTLGQRLRAGERIRILSPAANDQIVIVGTNGEVVIEQHCVNRGDCGRRLIVPSPADTEPSVFDIILQTAMRLIKGKPDRYSVHGVRGVDNDLKEGVCRFDEGWVDLRPVFQGMPKGLYYLKLRDLQPGASKTAVGPLQFDWDPQGVSALRANGLTPGIYEIRLLARTSDQYEPTSLTVWTLISTAPEFDRTNDSFRQAVSLTNKWRKTITDETKREVLRAYLDNLATAR